MFFPEGLEAAWLVKAGSDQERMLAVRAELLGGPTGRPGVVADCLRASAQPPSHDVLVSPDPTIGLR